ncbi:hypothetical protein [Nocardioides sp.]|uniref:hypothetical protein n=1 Tax=Nocardioides sp. TaxID=35761 RepID=UPI002C419321|nr:hypothetical protein [Nocardioides sp.]HXH78179.1 hypothetical protein [Nocardioides sp.]
MSAAERAEWARRLIARAEFSAPTYGSAEWLALPEGDARKVAAVVVAAESWARDADDLEVRLRLECEALSRANKRAEDVEYTANAAEHREQWAGLDKLVTHPLAVARRAALGEVA